jgi:hypothetical protein
MLDEKQREIVRESRARHDADNNGADEHVYCGARDVEEEEQEDVP